MCDDDASGAVRLEPQLLEEQETKLMGLRAALTEDEESGPATPFDFDAFIALKIRSETADSCRRGKRDAPEAFRT